MLVICNRFCWHKKYYGSAVWKRPDIVRVTFFTQMGFMNANWKDTDSAPVNLEIFVGD